MGSTIFTALTVGAVVSLLAPDVALGGTLVRTGSAVMLGADALSTLLMRRRHSVARIEGAVLVAAYVAVIPALGS